MPRYYEVVGKIDGQLEVIFGSYDRSDCVYELDAERDSLKDEGYKGLKVISREVTEQADPEIYADDTVVIHRPDGVEGTCPSCGNGNAVLTKQGDWNEETQQLDTHATCRDCGYFVINPQFVKEQV